MLKKKLRAKTKTKPKTSPKTKSSTSKRPSRKQRRNKKMLEDDSILNIWNGNGFVMCGLGEKIPNISKNQTFLQMHQMVKTKGKKRFC